MNAVPAVASEPRSDSIATAAGWRERIATHESIIALVLCGVLAWLAQFHHFAQFGLYEDDYWFISEAMGKDPSYLLTRFETALRLPQGRPFGFFLPDLFSFVGDKLGGLPAIYLLGFGIVTLNTFLCYRLLRMRVPSAAAAAGAAVFCLFAADTTKILLTHDFQLQPSLTFALLSAIAYASGRPALAYVLGAGALLSYENGFLALFGVPLLARRWDRSMPRELARNAGVLVAIVLGVVVVRFLFGESRATESVGGIGGILPRLLGSLVIGPPRSLAAMLYMPLREVPAWDVETLALAVVALVVFAALFWALPRPRGATRDALQLGAAGLVMLVLAYALAFTHFPPVALVGRGTSVHLGATLGMSVLGAAVAWLVLQARRALAIGLLATYLALSVGYYVTIEKDFMRSWQAQRAFWQEVARCCSDLQDGTVVLYELQPSDETTTFIFTNSWGDALVLGEMLRFPSDWSSPPRLFSLTDWRSRVQADAAGLRWWVPAASWDEHWEPLPQANVILIRRAADGHLARVTGSVDVAGEQLQLKAPGAPVAWPPAQLYDLLLR